MGSPKYDRRVVMEVDRDGVAVITLNNPPMNALHPDVLRGLMYQLEKGHSNPSVKAIVITGANGKFSAGFDVSLFKDSPGGGIISGENSGGGWVNEGFCRLLEAGSKPTVAAVNGICLGGGCEAIVACNARICTPRSKIGLPELQLGIIPGFGGTQRLPRLVGVEKALDMMLRSKPVSGSEAKRIGLVEEVVPEGELIQAARDMALKISRGQLPKIMTLYRTDRIPSVGDAQGIFNFARAQAAKTARGLQHPQLCIDAVQYGLEEGGMEGLAKERAAFDESVQLDTHHALIHVFFAMRSTKRIKGVTDIGLKPRPMDKVAVLGGGLMGSGIATSAAVAGCEVLLKEINPKFLQDGIGRIRANLQSMVKKKQLSNAQMAGVLSRVKGVLTYDDFSSVDMVIEAVIENIGLKQKIFADLERACNSNCILATNTSTIDIQVVGASTHSTDRVVGAHFFSPAHLMPLLEIVRSEDTSRQVVLDTLEFASKIKKTPVVVGNCTGFAVNRVFFPYTMGACLLVDLGLSPYRIDKAIQGNFGMPLGPFRLSDLVGADVGMHVGRNFVESFPERVYPTQLMILMNKYKRLGEKTGKGYYKFEGRRQAVMDPELEPILAESREAAGLMAMGKSITKMSDQEIIEFIFFPVINEGCRVISERIVDKPADLDVATILGMGFPAPRGGLIFWADLVGAHHINKTLNRLAQKYEQVSGFFKPSAYLSQCAATGQKLGRGAEALSRL